MQDFLRGGGQLTPAKVTRFAGTAAPKMYPASRIWRGICRPGKRRERSRCSWRGARPGPIAWKPPWRSFPPPPRPPGSGVIGPVAFTRSYAVSRLPIARLRACRHCGQRYFRRGLSQNPPPENRRGKAQAFTDLKEGDYVVHEAHGVGIFRMRCKARAPTGITC